MQSNQFFVLTQNNQYFQSNCFSQVYKTHYVEKAMIFNSKESALKTRGLLVRDFRQLFEVCKVVKIQNGYKILEPENAQ